MARGSSRTTRLMIVAACALALAACKDNGLKDRNLPLAEAQYREFRYPSYQAMPDNLPIGLAGQHWLSSSAVMRITPSLLVPVGDNGSGTTLYALKGATAPFDRIYAPAGGNSWHPLLRIN
jgi:hypothetical protein